jgi:hypothetical protein
MIHDLQPEVILALAQKDYVLFAPKSSRGLKADYPELDKADEFRGIGKYDMLFIWAWACMSSPFYAIDHRDTKLNLCVQYAYPPEQQERKYKEYEQRFTDSNMTRAMEKMGRYNLAARVGEYMALKIARDNYTAILSQDVRTASPDEKEAWLKQSIIAQKGLAEQRQRIEGADLGVAEADETRIAEAIDLLAMHHQQN